LIIGFVYTYLLTPEMSALGLSLNLFSATQEIPSEMQQMQQSYWGLELLKLIGTGVLLSMLRPTLNEIPDREMR
jgi:hypothetical protein